MNCSLFIFVNFLYFRKFDRETSQSRNKSISLSASAVHVMRVIQLKALRWLGLGFASRRHRLGCVVVIVFIFILIMHFLTYRDPEWVSGCQCCYCSLSENGKQKDYVFIGFSLISVICLVCLCTVAWRHNDVIASLANCVLSVMSPLVKAVFECWLILPLHSFINCESRLLECVGLYLICKFLLDLMHSESDT